MGAAQSVRFDAPKCAKANCTGKWSVSSRLDLVASIAKGAASFFQLPRFDAFPVMPS